MVKYRGTVDVYQEYTVLDSSGRDFVTSWDYENPEQIKCNVTELNPDNVQELFRPTYEYGKTIKLETEVPLEMSSRVGNVRLDIPLFSEMLFNVNNVQPRVDYRGKVIGYRIFCRIVTV